MTGNDEILSNCYSSSQYR